MKSLVCILLALAGGDDPIKVVQRVAEAQERLPWFWSPPLEGLADIPYTYKMKQVRRTGKDAESRTHMERIPQAGGSYFRCLSQNEASPCAEELVKALEADSRKRETFTAEDKARAAAVAGERRGRRRAFWTEFPRSLRFERSGMNEIRFVPARKSEGLLGRIAGRFQFDMETGAITALEYEVREDAENATTPLAKGTRFSIELTKLAEGRYVPARVRVHRKAPKRRQAEEWTMELSNFRRFVVESEIRFAGLGDK